MATSYFEAEDLFVFNSIENSLELRVIIGDGQSNAQGNGCLIFKDTKLISSKKKATIKSLKDLTDKWLTFVAVIKDKLEETNWTSVTIDIQESGYDPISFGPFKREVQNHLDTVCYSIKIKLKIKE